MMNRLTKTLLALVLIATLLTGVGRLLWAMPDQSDVERSTATATQAASQLYAQGEYALAAQAYSQLIDQGYGDVALFFNRGLAYHQAGETAKAVASLREAAARAPRNEQIRAALAEIEAAAPPALNAATATEVSPFAMATRWLTADELAILALAFWMIIATLLLTAILRRQPVGTKEQH